MKFVQTEKAPAAVGPYSQATVANGMVYCSGQIPLVPATGELLTGDIEKASAQCLANLDAVLTEAGTTREQIVKVNVFLTDMNDFAKMNAVYEDFFGNHKPARAAVEVSALPKGAEVEMECIALVS